MHSVAPNLLLPYHFLNDGHVTRHVCYMPKYFFPFFVTKTKQDLDEFETQADPTQQKEAGMQDWSWG